MTAVTDVPYAQLIARQHHSSFNLDSAGTSSLGRLDKMVLREATV